MGIVPLGWAMIRFDAWMPVNVPPGSFASAVEGSDMIALPLFLSGGHQPFGFGVNATGVLSSSTMVGTYA